VKKYFKYLKGDGVIWVITLLLLAFSLVSVYSFVPILVKMEGGTPFKYLFKHMVYVSIAFTTMFWIHKKNPIYFSKLARFSFYASIGLLIFTFFFGTKVNGAGRWIPIPFVGLTFQASDFAKLALILYISRLLAKKKDVLNSWKQGFWPILIPIIVICGLIVKDNFSTAAIVFMICLVILFLGKVPLVKIGTLVLGGILLFALVVATHKALPNLNLLPRYQTWENRILSRFDMKPEIADEIEVVDNAQAKNAELGIFNGGILGQGPGDGKVKEYVPEAYADFFFASFVEEFGLLGAIILVMLYLILLYRIIKIALKSDKLFETYAVLGIGILLLSQATVNMLVCTGVFPVTGQNMPLLAMGGSALIMTCVGIGIVQSIATRQQTQEEKTDEKEKEIQNAFVG
jgi:cell division protein FtsW